MRVITTELVETKRYERGRRITPWPEREAVEAELERVRQVAATS